MSIGGRAAAIGVSPIGATLGLAAGILGLSSTPTAKDDQPTTQFVVRGGLASPSQLARGTAQTPFGLYGFSVQTAPRVSVEGLAKAGRFPNKQISVTTIGRLQSIPGVVVHAPTPGRGLHGTVTVPNPPPQGLFDAISSAFTTQPNPHSISRD